MLTNNESCPGTPDQTRITVRNLQRKVAVDTAVLQGFARQAFTICLAYSSTRRTKLRRLRDISILLISDRRMAELHRRFLNQPGSTDVITFDHGEICISAETARKHARRFNSSTVCEIQLYIVHGLLHLNGFDDRTKAGARKMGLAQQKILMATTPAR